MSKDNQGYCKIIKSLGNVRASWAAGTRHRPITNSNEEQETSSKSNQHYCDGSSKALKPVDSSNVPVMIEESKKSIELYSPVLVPRKLFSVSKLGLRSENYSKGSSYAVRVDQICGPVHFTIQPYNDDYRRFKIMTKDLHKYCSTQGEIVTSAKIETGEAYVAKNPRNGLYCRIIVVERCSDSVLAKFCDFGNTLQIPIQKIKFLPEQFRTVPMMGIKAKLYKLQLVHDDLESATFERLAELVNGKLLFVIVKQSIESLDVQELPVELVDTFGETDIFVSDILVEERLCQRAREEER